MSKFVAWLVCIASSIAALIAGYCYLLVIIGLGFDVTSITKLMLTAISAGLTVSILSWISPPTRRWHYPILFVAPCLYFAAGAGAAWTFWVIVSAVTFAICLATAATAYWLRARKVVA